MSESKYSITIDTLINGSISPSKSLANYKDKIELSINPNSNYKLDNGTLTVNFNNNNKNYSIPLFNRTSFNMPKCNVIIKAEFYDITAPEAKMADMIISSMKDNSASINKLYTLIKNYLIDNTTINFIIQSPGSNGNSTDPSTSVIFLAKLSGGGSYNSQYMTNYSMFINTLKSVIINPMIVSCSNDSTMIFNTPVTINFMGGLDIQDTPYMIKSNTKLYRKMCKDIIDSIKSLSFDSVPTTHGSYSGGTVKSTNISII